MDVVFGVVGTLVGVVLGHWLARRGTRKDAEHERTRRDAADALDIVIGHYTASPPLLVQDRTGAMRLQRRADAPSEPPREQVNRIIARGRLPEAKLQPLVSNYFNASKRKGAIERPKGAPDFDASDLDDAAQAEHEAFVALRDSLRNLAR